MGAAGTVGLGMVGGLLGLAAGLLLDKASLTPKERGGIKVGGAFVAGLGAALVSPPLGVGFGAGLGAEGAHELYQAFTSPAASNPSALGAVSSRLRMAQGMGVVTANDLRAVESAIGYR